MPATPSTLEPSPRARGAPRAADHHEVVAGTIPACAGSTGRTGSRSTPRGTIPACAGSTRPTRGHRAGRWDHPRVRGEHGRSGPEHVQGGGPSPRARGARWSPSSRTGASGTIPACAGSTSLVYLVRAYRGEHAFSYLALIGILGPSPRARGAHGRPGVTVLVAGTIPACAGSTRPTRGHRAGRWDHPRVRGEHTADQGSPCWSLGPSPRARGAHGRPGVTVLVAGTIPACAGSTRGAASDSAPRRDHPRVRGEHGRGQRPGLLAEGPSPRARGAPLVSTRGVNQSGTIPACAGSTLGRRAPRPPTGDHPRVRGEHETPIPQPHVLAGPSPRARGARDSVEVTDASVGTIPACAGSTVNDLRTYQWQAATFPTSSKTDTSPKTPKEAKPLTYHRSAASSRLCSTPSSAGACSPQRPSWGDA